jgi:uncharacterized protein (TIGR03118 family)
MKRAQLAVLAAGLLSLACGNESPAVAASDSDPLHTDQYNNDNPYGAVPPRTNRLAVRVARTDIVSDQEGAKTRDPLLINAWGLAFSPAGVAWISAAGSGTATIYSPAGEKVVAPVKVPLPAGSSASHSSPTGQVFNDNGAYFMGDRFILVTEEGTIVGWQPTGGANVRVTLRDTSYKGATLSSIGGQIRLYAADFRNGKIDVFDANYTAIRTDGNFVVPQLPAGFAPFNIQEVEGGLVVTYAKQDDARADEVKGVGNGFVALFDNDGHYITQIAERGVLNAPWGVAMAPLDNSRLSRRLLIGNFGDGRINVYRLDTRSNGRSLQAVFEGALADVNGAPLQIDGLWAIRFGVGAGGFDTHQLYFTAGPGDEQHGVFGALKMTTAQNPAPQNNSNTGNDNQGYP